MAIPPYIPGTIAALSAVGIGIIAVIDDPTQVKDWTDRQVILVLCVVLFLCIGYILKWVATKMLACITANTEVMHEIKDALQAHNGFFESITKGVVSEHLGKSFSMSPKRKE